MTNLNLPDLLAKAEAATPEEPEFLNPIGPYRLAKPYGSYLWEIDLAPAEQLQLWKTSGVFPETHKRLMRLGLCDNYRLTAAGRDLLSTLQEIKGVGRG